MPHPYIGVPTWNWEKLWASHKLLIEIPKRKKQNPNGKITIDKPILCLSVGCPPGSSFTFWLG